jgi:hypothetical protein
MSGPLGAIGGLGQIAGLFTKVIGALQGLLTRKDQIELGQARQAEADRTAVDQARERMDEATAKPVDTEKELRDGTF